MSPRKRKRSQAFPESLQEDSNATFGDKGPGESEKLAEDSERLEKEREVWDALREEHFEAIEQMPLALHRQLSLMQQLDEQAHGYATDLLPTLQKYIEKRRAMAQVSYVNGTIQTNQYSVEKDIHQGQGNHSVSDRLSSSEPSLLRMKVNGSPMSTPATPLRLLQITTSAIPRTPTPMGVPPERVKPPETTRGMLSHVAWLSEELLRASQEKVNLAQAAHDSVDRHVRLLDQAIKEQQAALALSQHTDGNAGSVLLPDLVVPKWSRTTRATLSPMSPEGDGSTFDDMEPDFTGVMPLDEVAQPPMQRGKGRRSWKGNPPPDQSDSGSKSLKITLPAMQPPDANMNVDPNEELYCVCNRVSFGEMIACDGPSCEREWFHLSCVGLTEIPKGKWFCEECRNLKKSRSSRV